MPQPAGNAWESASLARTVFRSFKNDDPIYQEIKTLLINGRRAEAISLICRHDQRFADGDARDLMKMIMSTLTDTKIDF